MKKKKPRSEIVSRRLKTIRKTLKLKQKVFAASLGVSAPSYSELEGGKYNPNFDFLQKIVEKYNVNLYYLIFGQGEMFGGLCEKCPANIGDILLMKDEEMKKFFHYFSRSAILQYKLMAYFHTLLGEDDEVILKELEEFEESRQTGKAG
jgi:transcriptional regulator with XRE-family HTH domain